MNKEQAKEQGFSHNEELYGVPIWYNEYTGDVECKSKLLDWWLDFLIWIECTIGVNEHGFPIKLLSEID